MAEQDTQKTHYIHKMSATVQERIAGIFVVSAVLVIAALVFNQIQTSHLLDDRIEYHAYLKNAQGVSTETQINVSGIEVGQVESIDITPDNRVHVTFFVYEGFQRLIRSDSTGELNKLSVIGNAVIIIKAGSHQLPMLEPGATIPIEEPTTLDELMATLEPVVIQLNDMINNVSAIIASIDPQQLQNTSDDISQLIANLRAITEQVNQGKGMVGRVLYDPQIERRVSETIDNVGTIVDDFGPIVKDIGPIVKNTDPMIRDAGLVVKELKQDMQQVERILQETEQRIKEIKSVIEPATSIMQQSSDIADDIQKTTGIISQEIEQLPEMLKKVQGLLDSSNQTIENAQDVWPLNTVVPPSNKDTVIQNRP